jgi:hypothetical protein
MKVNWKQFFCIHWLHGSIKKDWNKSNCSPWGYSRFCKNCGKETYSGI